MKFPTLFISAAYLASIVSAQKPIVSITSPLANTHYKVGTEAIISWVNPSVPTISQIVLAKGPPTGLQPVMTIATNVNAGDLQYTWKIPEGLPSGSDYAFEFGTSPDIAFTGAFNIEGGSGGSLPSQNTTSGTAASSSASSASSASASASSVSSSSAVSSSSPSSASVSSAASSAPSVSNSGSSIGSASTPAVSSGTSNTQVSPSASASHSTSSASKEASAGQTMVAVGLAAIVVAQQFF